MGSKNVSKTHNKTKKNSKPPLHFVKPKGHFFLLISRKKGELSNFLFWKRKFNFDFLTEDVLCGSSSYTAVVNMA